MGNELYIGIDGGGTHTRAMVGDRTGRILAPATPARPTGIIIRATSC